MAAIRLTPKQKEVFEHLKATPGGVLRQHIKPTRLVCFRLLDKDKNPLKNYGYGIIHALVDKNVLELTGHDFVLKATSEN